MRYTLEQLKAMSDGQLYAHWRGARFPFESLRPCGNCLTDHVVNRTTIFLEIECSNSHAALTAASLQINDWAENEVTGANLREHLEELYALRLFYDHLYPAEEVAPTTSVAPEELPTIAESLARGQKALDRLLALATSDGQTEREQANKRAREVHFERLANT